ncbi:ABC transporter ATP-binding protein [Acanthopleuribacter pedis]|uniref:ABC transporter ATP-binding protein n=1 Tax=Acanthopleuribacter pedis TaxID=442870 RepID=A0A8J7Q0U9_9BACT|nr:ATP-binding cassette domain-containing protein [Acanthopleuribacter pedis]MBO1317139.1 ABC transporter ATP-binding protein [Acanthopleuribacter pedis]
MSKTPLIEVLNWSVSFGRKREAATPCIRHIGFSLTEGEVLGIVGASGTGKSVTIQSLIGLYDYRTTHLEGEPAVKILGESPFAEGGNYRSYQKRLKPLLRGRIGMVFQDHRALMNPLKTVGQHFRDASRLAGIRYSSDRVQEVLDLAGCAVPDKRALAGWLARYPRSLSGGEAQRIQIAVSLISPDLKLLICDEVTSNLDTHNQWRVIRLLQRLHREQGIAMLFVSHHWDQIQELSHRILVLKKDEISNVGTPYRILSREEAQDEFTLRNDETLAGLIPAAVEHNRRKTREEGRPVIQARGLRKSFDGREVLHGVNLTVQPGERYALIGESGSGKSTLARLILGVERMTETEGDLMVMGRSRKSWDGYDPHMQMVFQNFAEAVNPHMTSDQHLDAVLTVNARADRSLAKAWLRDLEIQHCLPKTTRQMSGGEKRRLGLVEAFAVRPRLILADEPTAGLDRARQTYYLKQLERYREEMGAETVSEFMISHDLHLVGSYAERIGVLYSGWLVQEAQTDVLLADEAQYLHPYTELLLRAKDLELDEQDTEETGGEGCVYYSVCHRRNRVACDFKDKKPEITHYPGGWSLCPYPV